MATIIERLTNGAVVITINGEREVVNNIGPVKFRKKLKNTQIWVVSLVGFSVFYKFDYKDITEINGSPRPDGIDATIDYLADEVFFPKATGGGGGGGVSLGESSTTAYRGDRGKVAYDHSQVSGNPHNTTKNDVGLGVVQNIAPADMPVSTAQAAADTAIATQLLGGVTTAGNTLNKLYTLYTSLQAFINGDDIDLDTIRELADAIKSNQSIIDVISANKVDTDDVANTLDIIISGKVLDARQGKILSDAINTLSSSLAGKATPADIEAALEAEKTHFGESFTGDGSEENPYENASGTPIAVDGTIIEDSENPVAGGAVFNAFVDIKGGSTKTIKQVYDELYALIVSGNITPAAPTGGTVNDSSDTFGFTVNPTYTTLSDYEYRVNGGSWTTVTANPIVVGDVAIAIGQLEVRVKAASGRNASNVLTNATAFTVANITPAAPTSGVVDDTANTFGFTVNPSYTSLSDYEYQLNGGSITTVTANPIVVGNVAVAIGDIKVRVKAASGRNVSGWLSNATAFLLTPAAPTSGVVDDTANTFGFTTNPSYTTLSDYEYRVNGGSWTTVTANPISVGDIAVSIGQLELRIKAATGRTVSPSLTNSTAFTVAGGGGGDAPLTNFVHNNASNVGNDVTSSALSTSIAKNPGDGSTSTLALKRIEIGYDPSWTGGALVGLTISNVPGTAGSTAVLDGSIYVYDPGNRNMTARVDAGEFFLSYELPASSTSKIRIRAEEDTVYWRIFFEASTDSGATWTVLNTGGTITTDVPKTTPLYGMIAGFDNGVVVKDVKGGI